MRLFGRNDTSLAAALIVGVFLLFHQPLQLLFDTAHDIERQYHLDLVQALVVLGAMFAFHQYRKYQDAKAALAAAAADATQAQVRARELERLVGLSRALAMAADFMSLHQAFRQYLPKFTQDRPCWLLMCQEGCWDVLVRGASDHRPADELEAIATRALAGCAGASSTRVDGLACFPLIVGGHAVGVLLVHDLPALADPDARALEGAAAVGAVAIRNVQALLEARENSLRDRLTGCFNRGHAVDTLTSELRRARRGQTPLSLIMFDVDHFKRVNDSSGHLAGDHVLAEVGRRLGEVLRLSDVKCRYGGDEFLLILPDTPAPGARQLAESIRREMAQIAVRVGDADVRITVSIGVVTAAPDEDAHACIARVDAALYRAKHAGRNCFRVGEPVRAAALPRVETSETHVPAHTPRVAPDVGTAALATPGLTAQSSGSMAEPINELATAVNAATPPVEAVHPPLLGARTADAHGVIVTTPPRRILVVDDEDSVRSLEARILREAHYDVITAAGGPEALAVARDQPAFDLFVLDVMMPEMTGDELARQLRVREPDAKVLYFTGYADRLFQAKPVLGAHEAFLEKPITMTGLCEAVSLLLFGHTHGPEATPTTAC